MDAKHQAETVALIGLTLTVERVRTLLADECSDFTKVLMARAMLECEETRNLEQLARAAVETGVDR